MLAEFSFGRRNWSPRKRKPMTRLTVYVQRNINLSNVIFSMTMNLGSPLRRKTMHAFAAKRSRDLTETAGIHSEN